MDIDIIGIFRLLRRIPQIPKIEIIIENVKYLIGSVSGTWNLREEKFKCYQSGTIRKITHQTLESLGKAERELTEIEVYGVLRKGFGQYHTESY